MDKPYPHIWSEWVFPILIILYSKILSSYEDRIKKLRTTSFFQINFVIFRLDTNTNKLSYFFWGQMALSEIWLSSIFTLSLSCYFSVSQIQFHCTISAHTWNKTNEIWLLAITVPRDEHYSCLEKSPRQVDFCCWQGTYMEIQCSLIVILQWNSATLAKNLNSDEVSSNCSCQKGLFSKQPFNQLLLYSPYI